MLKKIEETKSLVFFMIGGILIGVVPGSLGLLLAPLGYAYVSALQFVLPAPQV